MQNKNDDDRSDRAWVSVKRITASHSLSRNSLYKLIDEGIIRAKLVRIPGSKALGHRLINVRSVERFIESADTYAPPTVTRKMRQLARASVASRRAAKLKLKRRHVKHARRRHLTKAAKAEIIIDVIRAAKGTWQDLTEAQQGKLVDAAIRAAEGGAR